MNKIEYISKLISKYKDKGFNVSSSFEDSDDFDDRLDEYQNDISFYAKKDEKIILVFVDARFNTSKKDFKKINDKNIDYKFSKASNFITDYNIELKECIFHYIIKESNVYEKSIFRFNYQFPNKIKVKNIRENNIELTDDMFIIQTEQDKKDEQENDNNSFLGAKISNKNSIVTKVGAKAQGEAPISYLADKYKVYEAVMIQFLIDNKILAKKKQNGTTFIQLTKLGEKLGGSYKQTKGHLEIQFPRNLKFDSKAWSSWILKQVSETKKNGDAYEKYIGKTYEENGYFVKYNGLENGKEDNSTDVIAIKNNKVLFIQCKHWTPKYCREHNKYLEEKDLISFKETSKAIINSNSFYEGKEFKWIFLVSNENTYSEKILDLVENDETIDFKVVPFLKKKDVKNA